jgi:hypothetical protein
MESKDLDDETGKENALAQRERGRMVPGVSPPSLAKPVVLDEFSG